MGQEAETEERRDAFAGFTVDDALLDAAGTDAVAMHCLPAHRGEEITSAVMDGPRSLIWDQSENRLHVQKALLVEVLGRGGGMSESALRAVQGGAPARPRRALRGRSTPPRRPTARRPGSRRTGPCRYVGLGGVLARLGRTDDALAAYAAALDRAPDDEVALRGRADVLAAAGRRPDAADDLDRLSSVLERDGRLADACDAARRALELAESRGRRRQLADLAARVAAVAADDPAAAAALERALAVLEIRLARASAAGAGVGRATSPGRRRRTRWS